jgi:Ala-tRNA(Pro) deacylase
MQTAGHSLPVLPPDDGPPPSPDSAETSTETPVTRRLVAWLRERGAAFRLMEHAPVYTSDEAARVRGTPIEAGAKALVLQSGDQPVQVVLPGHRRVDNARLREILGTRTLRFAKPDELLAVTGCTPGAVPPFGNLFGLPVLVDEELTRCQEIAFNAGSNTVSIAMRTEDFLRLSGAQIYRLAKP